MTSRHIVWYNRIEVKSAIDMTIENIDLFAEERLDKGNVGIPYCSID